MEALNDPSPVLFPASDPHSRPGPVTGGSERVFQTRITGEYSCVNTVSPPDDVSVHSPAQSFVAQSGRLSTNRTEACDPSDAVMLPASDLQRHLPLQIPTTATGISTTTKCNYLVYYQNVRGLKSKLTDFLLAVTECDYDIIILVETWLDDSVNSLQLFSDDFDVYRRDRNGLNSTKRHGGGVLIAVRRKFSSKHLLLNDHLQLEQVWVRAKIGGSKVYICSFYLPPDRKNDITIIDSHLNSIRAIRAMASIEDHVIICGDYNYPNLDWRVNTWGGAYLDANQSQLTTASSLMIDGISCENLQQINILRNNRNRTLDLAFLDPCYIRTDSIMEAPMTLTPVDPLHPPFELVIQLDKTEVEEPPSTSEHLSFRKMNFDEFARFLRLQDWSTVTQANDVDRAVLAFTSIIRTWISQHVPKANKPAKPAWSNRSLLRLRRRANAAQRRFRACRSTGNHNRFIGHSRLYKNMNARCYRSYINRTQRNIRQNPKLFWNFVNSKRKSNGLPVTMHLHNNTASSTTEKVNLFAGHFAGVFCTDVPPTSDELNAAIAHVPANLTHLDIFTVTDDMVLTAVRKLKSSYSPGPDGIPSILYKKCAIDLLIPLTYIFNLSLRSSTFPAKWKESFMFPVYKKGDKEDIVNYRGITSLCSASKLLEIIVHKYLFFRCKSYISFDQHGFYPGRSVSTNLVEFTSNCLGHIENRCQVDVVYTDLKAAFDRVDRDMLLAKLRKLGSNDRLVAWLRSYLFDRVLRVKIGDVCSDPFSNTSGVPQGSNLGPLLFGVDFNDVCFVLPENTRLMYADDLKIFMTVNSISDCHALQALLNTFAEWCISNRIVISIDKCCIISFNKKQSPIMFSYQLLGTTLSRTTTVKDLGITLDANLTFNVHRSTIIDKANRQLGFIKKVSNELDDPHCTRALYCALVRPILETASVVWAPHHALWSARIEQVQRRFVSFALRNLHWRDPQRLTPYVDRCRLLELDTLSVRRKIDQAVFGAKILKSEIDSPSILSQFQLYAPDRLLRPRGLIHRPFHRRDYGRFAPIPFIRQRLLEVIDDFNLENSTAIFKNHLRTSRIFYDIPD